LPWLRWQPAQPGAAGSRPSEMTSF
jgi:hypothetical protein